MLSFKRWFWSINKNLFYFMIALSTLSIFLILQLCFILSKENNSSQLCFILRHFGYITVEFTIIYILSSISFLKAQKIVKYTGLVALFIHLFLMLFKIRIHQFEFLFSLIVISTSIRDYFDFFVLVICAFLSTNPLLLLTVGLLQARNNIQKILALIAISLSYYFYHPNSNQFMASALTALRSCTLLGGTDSLGQEHIQFAFVKIGEAFGIITLCFLIAVPLFVKFSNSLPERANMVLCYWSTSYYLHIFFNLNIIKFPMLMPFISSDFLYLISNGLYFGLLLNITRKE